MAVSLALGCGARALVEPATDDEDSAGQGAGGRAGSAGAQPSAGAGRGSTPTGRPSDEPIEIIPDSCAEPFRRSDDRERPCPYIYRGVCYPSDDCACSNACASEAQCVIDGFLDPDEPQRVRCISP
jgi:hypothetical protein